MKLRQFINLENQFSGSYVASANTASNKQRKAILKEFERLKPHLGFDQPHIEAIITAVADAQILLEVLQSLKFENGAVTKGFKGKLIPVNDCIIISFNSPVFTKAICTDSLNKRTDSTILFSTDSKKQEGFCPPQRLSYEGKAILYMDGNISLDKYKDKIEEDRDYIHKNNPLDSIADNGIKKPVNIALTDLKLEDDNSLTDTTIPITTDGNSRVTRAQTLLNWGITDYLDDRPNLNKIIQMNLRDERQYLAKWHNTHKPKIEQLEENVQNSNDSDLKKNEKLLSNAIDDALIHERFWNVFIIPASIYIGYFSINNASKKHSFQKLINSDNAEHHTDVSPWSEDAANSSISDDVMEVLREECKPIIGNDDTPDDISLYWSILDGNTPVTRFNEINIMPEPHLRILCILYHIWNSWSEDFIEAIRENKLKQRGTIAAHIISRPFRGILKNKKNKIITLEKYGKYLTPKGLKKNVLLDWTPQNLTLNELIQKANAECNNSINQDELENPIQNLSPYQIDLALVASVILTLTGDLSISTGSHKENYGLEHQPRPIEFMFEAIMTKWGISQCRHIIDEFLDKGSTKFKIVNPKYLSSYLKNDENEYVELEHGSLRQTLQKQYQNIYGTPKDKGKNNNSSNNSKDPTPEDMMCNILNTVTDLDRKLTNFATKSDIDHEKIRNPEGAILLFEKCKSGLDSVINKLDR